MRTVGAAVIENAGLFAAGVFAGVRENWQAVEGPLGVDAAGQCNDGGRAPRVIEGDGAERVAEDVAEEGCSLLRSCSQSRLRYSIHYMEHPRVNPDDSDSPPTTSKSSGKLRMPSRSQVRFAFSC